MSHSKCMTEAKSKQAQAREERVFNEHSDELDPETLEHVLVADALREAMTCYTELEALKAVLL